MSATMVREGGRVQLEQSNMWLVLKMAKMAEGRFPRAAIQETQQLIKIPRAEVREEKKWGIEFPGHKQAKAATERHPALAYKNHTDCCLPCQNDTTKHTQTHWRRKGTGSPPPEPAAPPPGTPLSPGMTPAPPGDTDRNECYEIEGMPSRCVYIHSPHPNTQSFKHNAYAKDS